MGTESAKIALFFSGVAEDRVVPEQAEVVDADPLRTG